MRRDAFRHDFPVAIPILWVSQKNRFGTPNVPGFSKSQKYVFSDTAYGHFDSPKVGENVYRIRTATNRPLTGRNRPGRERRVEEWL
jgi:hypothetical protein